MWLMMMMMMVVVVVCGMTVGTNGLTVNVHYPASNLKTGSTLFVRGDGCGLDWKKGKELAYSGKDMWTGEVSCDDGKGLGFKVLVDDEVWEIGANNEAAASASKVSVTPWFFTSQGVYEYVNNVYSKELKNTRNIVTYLPPSYYENPYKKEYPVIFAQDGQNLFNASTSFAGVAWECQTTLDELIVEGRMPELIMVGIDNTADRMAEYTWCKDGAYGGGKAELYLDWVESTVMPLMGEHYRIPAELGPDNTAILGSSLGGLLSCYAGFTRPSVYGKAICMSSSFWWADFAFGSQVMVDTSPPPKSLPFYLDVGTGEPQSMQDGFQQVGTHFEAIGWVNGTNLFTYLAPGGHHDEASWGARFWVPMLDLYGY